MNELPSVQGIRTYLIDLKAVKYTFDALQRPRNVLQKGTEILIISLESIQRIECKESASVGNKKKSLMDTGESRPLIFTLLFISRLINTEQIKSE